MNTCRALPFPLLPVGAAATPVSSTFFVASLVGAFSSHSSSTVITAGSPESVGDGSSGAWSDAVRLVLFGSVSRAGYW